MTSKDEERKALKKIQKIITDLGEDSYLATAFDGAIEDAERNIEDDAAYSYKQRYESMQMAFIQSEGELEKANRKVKELENHLQAVEAKVLTPSQNMTIQHLLRAYFSIEHQNNINCKKTIVEFCDTPQDIAFQNAVNGHKEAEKRIETIKELLEVLDLQVRPQ